MCDGSSSCYLLENVMGGLEEEGIQDVVVVDEE